MKTITSLLCVLVLLPLGVAAAQESAAADPSAGYRAELLRELDFLEGRLVSLAEATPQQKYGWRPGEGVRSVSEVYMHVAGGNFFLPRFAGVQPPEGLSRDMEKTVTQKAEVVDWLKKSFDHARQAVHQTSDADLDKPVKLFGRDATVRAVFSLVAYHLHEHLGQSIAYARMNSVVPPWTAARQAQQQQQQSPPQE